MRHLFGRKMEKGETDKFDKSPNEKFNFLTYHAAIFGKRW